MKWKYYNRAMIPTCLPHEEADTAQLADKNFWKTAGRPLLASWNSNFDCGGETPWWYVIKDTPYDLSALKAKRRYEITKGRKFFAVRPIDPTKHADDIWDIQCAAFRVYPASYRPSLNRAALDKELPNWGGVCFGAFDGGGQLRGYAHCTVVGRCIHFNAQKTVPEYERYALNAALVDGLLTYFQNALATGSYICDGQRSINHETAFQDYLEKYFGFRKAYCRLNIRYRPGIGWVIPMLYAMRGILAKFDRIGIVHQINAVLKMEEIARQFRRK